MPTCHFAECRVTLCHMQCNVLQAFENIFQLTDRKFIYLKLSLMELLLRIQGLAVA